MFRQVWSMVIPCGLLGVVACGGGGDGGGNNPDVTVASVLVNPGNQTVAAGSNVQYSATARNAAGNAISGKTFTWASSLTGIASITAAGLAATLAAGTTTITATTDGVPGSSQLTVTVIAPGGGTIQGTVTLTGSYLSPPRLAPRRAAVPDALPRLAGISKPPTRYEAGGGVGSRWVPLHPWAKHVADEWIVTFRAAALGAPVAGSPAYRISATADRVASDIRGGLTAKSIAGNLTVAGVSPVVLAARVRVDPGVSGDAIAAQLRADPGILSVERNYIVSHFGLRRESDISAPPPVVRPNDPLYPHQSWHYGLIDLPRAWRTSTGSNAVLVAVVDDGIRFDHPGISANLTNDGYDFVTNSAVPVCAGGTIGNAGDGDGPDPNPTQPLTVEPDPNTGCAGPVRTSGNHGLHVAGTIGASGNDGTGVTGVAWTVKIRPVRALGVTGSGTLYDIAQGVLYAAGLPADDGAGGTVAPATGARIINMSLGGPSPATVLQNAITAASNAGSLIIVSAGNTPTSAPNYPAAYPEAVSVSSVGPDVALASYSSFGSTIDIAAPGGDIADGDNSFGVMSTAYNYVTSQPIYDNTNWNGTSMAAPHVAGVAALVLAANPGLTAAQLRTRLETFTIDIGAAGKDNQYGNGLLNGRNALTQTNAAAATLRVRLMEATTGATVTTVIAQPNGSFQFTNVAIGSYHVYAGEDEEGDGLIGVNPRRWGAHGGSATPTTVNVAGPGTQTANFTVGFPIEVENNNTLPNADILPVGGYLAGLFANPVTDVDVSRVQISANGTYTFETSGLLGSCGFGLEEDTILELLSSAGTQLAVNDDIDSPAFNYCSRITTALTPGTYYLRVAPYTGVGAPGFPNRRYTVSAR